MTNGFADWLSPTLAFQDATGPVIVPGVAPAEGTATEGASADPADPSATGGGAAPSGGFPPWMLLVFGGLMVFMIWSSSSAQRKEKKKKEELMASLTRQDKVQTIGGVIGTIVEIDAESVLLRVDETSNARIRFARSAVQQVLNQSHLRKDVADTTVEPKPEPAAV